MKRGEIWIARWPNDPHKKPRPVLIVSNNWRNSLPHILDVIVVKITSLTRKDGSKKPINAAEDLLLTLKKESLIRCGSIYSLEKTWLTRQLQLLEIEVMAQVNEKLKNVLELGEE